MMRKSRGRLAPTRRTMLLGALASALARPTQAETAVLRVVTSFPEELSTRYEQEFEKAHPGVHVQFIWKQSRDALDLLSREGQGGADVYWAPALGNFPLLRDRGAFQKFSVDRTALPGALQGSELSDPSGFFEAYDVAGYGVVVNPALLRQRGLKPPRAWRDLAARAYAGQIVMPIAGKVGFSPALYDIVLQGEGWDEGWALLSEIAGNAELLAQGAFPTAMVKEGRAPLGLTIDFFALQAQANGLPVELVYPRKSAFLPAHIAITASTRRVELARDFVDFMLSLAGQRVMMEADSSRHPARPAAYESSPAALVNPFALPRGAILAYDSELGRRRPGLVATLFDLALSERHVKLVALWRSIHSAETNPVAAQTQAVKEARRLLGWTPVSARDAADPDFLERFSNRAAIDPALLQKWRDELDAAQARAQVLLAHAGAPL